MSQPNEAGVYRADWEEVLAQIGRAHVRAAFARCEDGLYRFGLSLLYSDGGFASPITLHAPGFATPAAAREAALALALNRLERMEGNGDPPAACHQIHTLSAQLRARWRQPELL